MIEASPVNDKRRRALLILAGVFLFAGLGSGGWWWLSGRWFESTDDAYVTGNVVRVEARSAGAVETVYVEDTQFVRAGAPLVRLDASDAQVALEQAEAQLARTVREVKAMGSEQVALSAAMDASESELDRAREDLARRAPLAGTGAVTREEVEHARAEVRAREAVLASAREKLAANRAVLGKGAPENHPDVQQAMARVEEAWLARNRAVVRAPVAGTVARRAVQLGQRVAPGAPLMALVPLEQVWVEANYKESQLRAMRVGQPVTLTADMYGSSVGYHGRVAGLGAGTGASFALLPPQNATGNWIKVVQRLPVRVALDPKDLAAHPLRVGLSMLAEVDLHDQSGPLLAQAAPGEPGARTALYGDEARLAREHARKVAAEALAGRQ